MEIQFENTCVNTYQPFFQQVRRAQLSLDGVVPDTNDDIGRIISVQTSVFLKGKEPFTGRITVSADVQTVLIYITEEEKQISFVRLSKGCEIDFEDEGISTETPSQIRLNVLNTEARVLNPRKVSVTVEMGAELTVYRQGESVVETKQAEGNPEGLYVKREERDAYFADLLCEKTFAFNEQYSFSDNQPAPVQLITETSAFTCAEVQQIGSRIILKGTVTTDVWYLAEGICYPLHAQFSSPFSQILDAGEAAYNYGRTEIALTSSYFDLVDTISGEKALDMELHAVIQMTGYCVQRLQYLSDAYSNRAPVRCTTRERSLVCSMRNVTENLNNIESIPITDDCAELLCTFASVMQATCDTDRLTASVALEILYLTRAGTLSSVKRCVTLEKETPRPASEIQKAAIRDMDLRLDGNQADCHIGIELKLESSCQEEIVALEAVEVDTEAAYDVDGYPTLTLVHVDDESLWELAKRYHSSVESIEKMNDVSGQLTGKLLLVPKQL